MKHYTAESSSFTWII